jgi:DNA-binding transcriptional ArsR family regulator
MLRPGPKHAARRVGIMIMGDADLASVGALLAEPARARVLLALADGRELPASMLAAEAGVSPSTTSEHLARLLDGGLVTVTPRGRYRYYRLAGPQVSDLIEAVSRVAPARPVTSLREGTRANALRRARSCYDHLGGRLAVALTSAFLERGLLAGHDGSIDLDRLDRSRPIAGSLDPAAYVLTSAGAEALRELGAEPPANRGVRCCVDWTEQRHHMAGVVGGILLEQFRRRDWVRPSRYHRALTVTDAGRDQIAARFGVAPE